MQETGKRVRLQLVQCNSNSRDGEKKKRAGCILVDGEEREVKMFLATGLNFIFRSEKWSLLESSHHAKRGLPAYDDLVSPLPYVQNFHSQR